MDCQPIRMESTLSLEILISGKSLTLKTLQLPCWEEITVGTIHRLSPPTLSALQIWVEFQTEYAMAKRTITRSCKSPRLHLNLISMTAKATSPLVQSQPVNATFQLLSFRVQQLLQMVTQVLISRSALSLTSWWK